MINLQNITPKGKVLPGTDITLSFLLLDELGVPATGQADKLAVTFTVDGAAIAANAGVVEEEGNGFYLLRIRPTSAGEYVATVTFAGTFNVVAQGLLRVSPLHP
jgi:hypothetical protein